MKKSLLVILSVFLFSALSQAEAPENNASGAGVAVIGMNPDCPDCAPPNSSSKPILTQDPNRFDYLLDGSETSPTAPAKAAEGVGG